MGTKANRNAGTGGQCCPAHVACNGTWTATVQQKFHGLDWSAGAHDFQASCRVVSVGLQKRSWSSKPWKFLHVLWSCLTCWRQNAGSKSQITSASPRQDRLITSFQSEAFLAWSKVQGIGNSLHSLQIPTILCAFSSKQFSDWIFRLPQEQKCTAISRAKEAYGEGNNFTVALWLNHGLCSAVQCWYWLCRFAHSCSFYRA